MGEKYKNKYRIPSARLQTWDYASEAAYFVTICTKDMFCFFGDIVKGKMHLSPVGEIVEQEWLKTFEMRPDMNLMMGEYITMPNHWHGIITIGENKYNSSRKKKQSGEFDNGETEKKQNHPNEISDNHHDVVRDAKHCVSTAPHNPNAPLNKFGPQSKNLSSVIRGFKIGVTTNARIILPEFGWQSGLYDHIIRNQQSFDNISEYIINNPSKWEDDKFYRK